MDIPKNKHGYILGSRGSTIRDLEQKTGCNIDVPDRNDKTSHVTLEGPPDNLGLLQGLIEDIVGEIKVVSSSTKITAIKSTIGLKDFRNKEVNDALFFPDTDKSDGLNYEIFLQYLSSPKKVKKTLFGLQIFNLQFFFHKSFQTLEVCVFTITDDAAANILIDLHKNGIKVRVITDDDQSASKGSDIQTLKKAGIPVEMDSTPYHMHNKFAIVDGILLLNGSYNWTSTANTKNNENMIVTNNKSLVNSYSEYFEKLWKEFSKN